MLVFKIVQKTLENFHLSYGNWCGWKFLDALLGPWVCILVDWAVQSYTLKSSSNCGSPPLLCCLHLCSSQYSWQTVQFFPSDYTSSDPLYSLEAQSSTADSNEYIWYSDGLHIGVHRWAILIQQLFINAFLSRLCLPLFAHFCIIQLTFFYYEIA